MRRKRFAARRFTVDQWAQMLDAVQRPDVLDNMVREIGEQYTALPFATLDRMEAKDLFNYARSTDNQDLLDLMDLSLDVYYNFTMRQSYPRG